MVACRRWVLCHDTRSGEFFIVRVVHLSSAVGVVTDDIYIYVAVLSSLVVTSS